MRVKRSWIAAFALAAGVLLNFAVPPFQNPDEPVHFGATLRVSLGESRDAATEKEIIRLMDRNNWWRFVGMGRPSTLPEKLGEIPFIMGGASYGDSYAFIRGLYLYHFLAGKLLRLMGVTGVEASYYLLRLFSFLLFLAALGFLGAGFGRLAGAADAAFTWAIFLVLLVPQFLVASIAVSPDMLCVALGAAFFYAAIVLFEGKASVAHYVLAILAGAAAFLADKSAFLLLPLALLLFVFLVSRKNVKSTLVLIPVFVLVFVLLAYGLTRIFPLQVENSLQIIKEGFAAKVHGLKTLFARDAFNRHFTSLFIDSFFLKFGWMAFGPGRAIVLAWRTLLAVAGAGLGLFLVTLPFIGRAAGRRANPILIKATLFSLVAVALQIFGARISSNVDVIYAQGRYLFPIMGFAAVLFVIGTKTAFDALGGAVAWAVRLAAPEKAAEPVRAGEFALKALAVAALFVLTIVIWLYIVPVFHLTIAAPHPGV